MRVITYISLVVVLLLNCSNYDRETATKQSDEKISVDFKEYWYQGNAEITSYQLEQARYGEIHKGHAVLIFVTEHLSHKTQIKTDAPGTTDTPVLKLNFTKKFNTGIYPYSMMTSSFVPVDDLKKHALKITTSSQEWCGHTYTQLNNRNKKYNVVSHSYFDDEGDQAFSIAENWLEDEIWAKLRMNPDLLPIGKVMMVPATFYVRLMHKELKAYQSITTLTKDANKAVYTINYPELKRAISITYNTTFPYEILGWEETYQSGWGKDAKQLTTKATQLKSLKSAYWSKNSVIDEKLRKELGL